MKNLNLSQLVGYGIIGLSIIFSSFIVANNLPKTPYIPDTLYVAADSGTPVSKEFMSTVEAANFINMSEENLNSLVLSGKLDGTFIFINESYIFSMEKLTQWMNKQMNAQASQS